MTRHASRPPATIAPNAHSEGALTRYRVPAGWVRIGMYVADLDRPWIDTPFFLQGFLVNSPPEVEALQKHCQYVIVELERSRPEMRVLVLERGERIDEHGETGDEVFGDLPESAKASRPESEPRPAQPPARQRGPRLPSAPIVTGSSPSRAPPAAGPRTPQQSGGHGARPGSPALPRATVTRAAHRVVSGRAASKGAGGASRSDARRMLKRAALGPVETSRRTTTTGSPLGSIWRAILGLFGLGSSEANDSRAPGRIPRALDLEIRAALPAGEKIRDWQDQRPVEEELPRAREVFSNGETVLAAVFEDVRGGKIPQIEQVEHVMGHVVTSMIDNPDALLWVAHMRERHEQSYRHAMRVALYMVALGRQLGFPRQQLTQLGTLGLLADIGKTRVPSQLLDKPGMLSPAEFEIVKEHVALGIELLERAGGLDAEILAGIAQHHERLDGSGYPEGRAGTEITLFGRMAAIVDSFAAMTGPRAYAAPIPAHEAMMNLFAWSGRSFHEPLVEQFVQAVGVFPVGSLVELSSGEVAIVLAHNRARRLEPRVLLLTDAAQAHLQVPVECDLFKRQAEASGRPVRILRGLPAGAHGLDPQDFYAAETAQEPAIA